MYELTADRRLLPDRVNARRLDFTRVGV